MKYSIRGAKLRPENARLYLSSIGTNGGHLRKGLATALIVAAVLTTGCKWATSSEQVGHGKELMAKVKPIINRLGVEFADSAPIPPSTEVTYFSDSEDE